MLGWFHELAAGRQAGYSEPCAISWAEMQAWQRMTDIDLDPWQAHMLRQLDRLWLAAWRAGRETQPHAPLSD